MSDSSSKPGGSVRWADFRQRLDRTRAPSQVPSVLAPAIGTQLYLRPRSPGRFEDPAARIDSSRDSPRTVRLEVTNLGLEPARFRVEVRDAAGRKVGAPLPRSHQKLAEGETRVLVVTPSKTQWKALRNDGSLLLPGDLPESHRALQPGPKPFPEAGSETGSLLWRVPIPPIHTFELPVEGDSGSATPWLEIKASADTRKPQRLTLECHPNRASPSKMALTLLMPSEEIRYRFGRGSEPFRDPHNPAFAAPPHDDWSLWTPAFVQKAWDLPGASPPLAGRLSTSHADRLEVEPDWIETRPRRPQTIRLKLCGDWLDHWNNDQETVTVHLTDADTHRKRDLLEVTLQRERPVKPAVRLVGPVAEAGFITLRNRRNRWCIELDLDNPGRRQAEIALVVGSEYRSPWVKFPPTPFPPPEELPTFSFDLSDEAVVAVRDAASRNEPLTAKLVSRGVVAWDPATIAFRPQVLPGLPEKPLESQEQEQAQDAKTPSVTATPQGTGAQTGGAQTSAFPPQPKLITSKPGTPKPVTKKNRGFQTALWSLFTVALFAILGGTFLAVLGGKLSTWVAERADESRMQKALSNQPPWVPHLFEDTDVYPATQILNVRVGSDGPSEQRGSYLFRTSLSADTALQVTEVKLHEEGFDTEPRGSDQLMAEATDRENTTLQVTVRIEPVGSGSQVEVSYLKKPPSG